MSLAPQNHSPDITDALDGSLTTWYESVNNCLKSSECVPGNYEYAQSPSYGNQCPIQEGASTKITVKCNRFEIIDIDNSYIDAVIQVPITIPAQHASGERNYLQIPPMYYIGYKNVFDMIDQYRISSNGDLIYTQNHCNYESFLNYISITDSAKENSPCYATYDKVRAKNPNVPGVYLQLDNTAAFTLTVDIPLKIPLNMFPVLRHLKYYPGFNGALDIEIYPSYKNLVWSNITKGIDDSFEYNVSTSNVYRQIRARMNPSQATSAISASTIDTEKRNVLGFTQINCQNHNRYWEHNNGSSNSENWVAQVGDQTFACSTSTLTQCHLYIAKYWIKMDVYTALEANYIQIPLLFPIQTVSGVNFTYPMNTQQQFNLQNTATLSHCDTMYVMFFANSNERTVSYNPEIKAQLMINGKYYPREPLSTRGDDKRFYNLTLDALNINNNPLMTVSKDVANSINQYVHIYETDTAKHAVVDRQELAFGDHSNFVFAVPLSTDEDFMGGISSNGSTIQIELVGTRDSLSSPINNYDWSVAPVALFLEDKILKIYSSKPPGKPQIQITNATLEQIVSSMGSA